MLIIGSFEHSIELEQALAVLEHEGISRKYIMAVPMDTDPTAGSQYAGKARDCYYKGIEIGMACATGSSVVGMSIGFILKWGPIFWGLIFAFAAFTIGFGMYLYFNKNNCRRLPKKLPEITVIVQCPENKSDMVMETMWKYHVLAVGHVPDPNIE